MHSNSENIEIMIYNKADEVIDKLFGSPLKRYQIGLETSMKGSDVIFDCVHLLYYKCHKLNLNRGRSYVDSPDWIKSKKSKIKPANDGHKCFQYAVTVALNYDKNGNDSQRISKIKHFLNKYNWKRINYLSKKKRLQNS